MSGDKLSTEDREALAQIKADMAAFQEKGRVWWSELMERAGRGDHAHPQYLAYLVHLFGVPPLSAEARYVKDRLTGAVKRQRGKTGYDKTQSRRLVLEFYERSLRECQADGKPRAHLRAEMATAQEFDKGEEYIRKLLQQARRERAAQDSK